MAKKTTDNKATAAEQERNSQVEKTENAGQAQGAAPEPATPGTTPEGQEPEQGAGDSAPGTTPPKNEGEPLLSLEELEAEFRVASWMQAALCRQQGWEKGKRITRTEYEAALDALGHRRLGGGRR